MIEYVLAVATNLLIWIMLTLSLNLVVGYGGMLHLGHIAFFGIGAYTSALLTLHQVPFAVALVLAGLVAAGAAWFLAHITVRLKGDYLALATLGFALVVYSVLLNWTSLTNGPLGIAGIPKPSFGGWYLQGTDSYFLFAIIILLLVLLVLYRLTSSRYGRLLEAVRDDEVGAAMLGKNVARLKVQSLMVSAFLAGLAGSLLAHYISYIDPSLFYLSDLIVVFTIIMVGGLASLRGTVIAGLVIIALPELLRFIDLPSHLLGPMRQIIYAVILLLILRFRPRGFLGRVDLD